MSVAIVIAFFIGGALVGFYAWKRWKYPLQGEFLLFSFLTLSLSYHNPIRYISNQGINLNIENQGENNYCTLNKDDMQMTASPSMIYMSEDSVKENADEFP